MVDINSIIEGTVKFRDGKKWKSRWCVMRKLSPVADCLHLQLYKDSKERYKNGPTKASLSLEHFLGIESGFTLDKESNTIAILCQDVIVNLAFDTREILMQWQVKISSNLGDDIQYLVLVASAATKVKIPAGPARLHIQNHRFCITTGVPPRLSGMWNIAHLRRYGVVENRFCFEGGSSSGKCEGFVVLITDHGDEISNGFRTASQGRLNGTSRYNKSLLDSPRKMKDTQSLRGENLKCDCSGSSFWPSQESRGIDSFIGCDSSSFIDEIDSNDELNHFSRKRLMTMERCMSCSSKRSLVPSMSRSSTITDNQGICFSSSSYKDAHQQMHLAQSKPTAMDRISMRSQESCGNISEFSMSRQYHQNPHYNSHDTSSHRSFSVPRSHNPPRSFVGSYENYDSPKILSPSNENQMENYDKPRSVKMYLEQNNAGGKQLTVFNGDYSNYDTPNIPKNIVCGCRGNSNGVQSHILSDDMKQDCTCHRVMSWADNWIPCRRGSGVENTGIPINRIVAANNLQDPTKCKLSDFSTADTDKSSLYALVDPAKKQTKRLTEEQSKPIHIPRATSQTPCANYANLEFEKSLEIYENAKEVLKRGNHLSAHPLREETNKENNVLIPSGEKTNENYIVMEIQEKAKTFPGYISMHPVHSQSKIIETKRDSTLPSTHKAKKLLLRLEEKSFSNPDLNRPSLDFKIAKATSSKLCETSSCDRKLVFKKSSSVDSFRYVEGDEVSPTIVEDEPSSLASIETYQDANAVEDLKKIDCTIQKKKHEHIKLVNVRHSESPSKLPNRDSSSSNDSGVSTASVVPKEYNEFELPLINQIKKRRQVNQNKPCVHSSLIRRSKSFDPFGDLSFNFTQNRRNTNGNVAMQNKSGKCPSLGAIMTGHIDSNSTSSGTSDMSDYIETLSLSSHSSSDIEALRNKHTVNTLRPRSGKEYQNIDRSTIILVQQASSHCKSVSPVSSISSSTANYVNITPVPESSESPSPGYQSSSSFQEEFILIKEN